MVNHLPRKHEDPLQIHRTGKKKNREGRGGKGCGEQRRLRREGRSAEGGEGERDGGRRERRVSDYRT